MTDQNSTGKKFTISEHFGELRQRLIYSLIMLLFSFMVCYYFAPQIYAFLVRPLAQALPSGDAHRMIYTGLTEAFFTYIKLALFAAFFVSLPFIATQIYIFIAPGLYKNEKKIIFPYLIATPALFIAGSAIAYYIIFPWAWKFFLSFETHSLSNSLALQFEAKISEYLSLVMHIILAFGIAFQLPVLLTLLAFAGYVTASSLAQKRKLAIVIIFAIAAVITPPDVISQIALAIPMVMLYEISILGCKWIEKSRGTNA